MITHYALQFIGLSVELRVYGERFDKGFTTINYLPGGCNEKALSALRAHGAKMAKRNSVEFKDETV